MASVDSSAPTVDNRGGGYRSPKGSPKYSGGGSPKYADSGGSSSRSSRSTIVGDRAQRITVPMPRSMDEIHGHARRFGGAKGKPDLFHHGKKEIQHDGHVDNLAHEHVIVVAKTHCAKEPYDTTHSSAFVRHALEKRVVPGPPQPPPKTTFEGVSTHAMDYVAHKIPERPTFDPPARPRTEPFQGESTYKSNYLKHKMQPRPTAAPIVPPKSMPFEGITTYTDGFIKHPISPKQMPKAAEPPPKMPFEGATEYAQGYIKHHIAKKEYVHIEPEKRQPDGGYKSHARRRAKSARL